MADIMKEGMTNRAPKGEDASMNLPKSPTVDQDATRKDTAATPKSLGPRTA